MMGTLTILTGELTEQKLPLNSAGILAELCTKNYGKYLQDDNGATVKGVSLAVAQIIYWQMKWVTTAEARDDLWKLGLNAKLPELGGAV